jgi:hypothetical protein
VLALSRTLRAGAKGAGAASRHPGQCLRAVLGGQQVGTEGMSAPVEQREFGLGCGRLAVIGIKRSLSLQEDAGDIEESVGDAANGATVGVAALA